jgi:cold shock CspA family protein
METPLQLETEGFAPSAHVRDLIEANLSKLEARFGRITSCRVAIHAPGSHHRMGEPYAVSIHAALPDGREVNVGKVSRAADRRQADINFAVNDAFRRAVRQLRDNARILRGDIKSNHVRPMAVVSGLDAAGGHGFLATEDGREVYFHKNAVLNGSFARLQIGDRVLFHEEAGEKGPQASTVQAMVKRRRKAEAR